MLTASVVTYHTDLEELRQCIESVGRSSAERLYVVDNSSDEAIRDLCGSYAFVSYIPSDNRGYGAGHNQAIRQVALLGSRYHLVINSDIEFDPADLQQLTAYMDGNGNVGAVQPRIVNPDGSLQYTVRMLPTPFDLIIRRFMPRGWFDKRRQRYELRHLDHDREFDVAYHQGSFMMLRMKALCDIGGFDERFFMYPEDIDLTRRIHQQYRTMYVPFVTVVHHHRAASYKSPRMLRIHIVNMIRYFNKWGWLFDAERRRINRTLRHPAE